jgi:hypothetical protein
MVATSSGTATKLMLRGFSLGVPTSSLPCQSLIARLPVLHQLFIPFSVKVETFRAKTMELLFQPTVLIS